MPSIAIKRRRRGTTVLAGGGVATYSISGTVTNLADGSPLSGVTVALGAYNDTTAADGTFTVADVPAGTSGTLTATKSGYEFSPSSISIAAMSGNLTSQDFDAILWIFLDTFTTDDASPIASPRSMEGGGPASSWTATQTGGTIEIVSSQLEITGPGASQDNTKLVGDDTTTCKAGRAIYFDRISGDTNCKAGFLSSASEKIGMNVSGVMSWKGGTTSNLGLYDSYLVVLGTDTVNGEAKIKVLGKTGSTWYLLCARTDTHRATISPFIESSFNTAKAIIDNYKMFDLGSPWTTEFGLATNRVASPSTGESFTGTADGFFEFVWTCGTGETLNFMFRRSDDNNTMIVRLVEADNKIYLYQKDGGVETELGATGGIAQTLNNGTAYTVTIMADGANIIVRCRAGGINDVTKQNITNASYGLAQTGVKVSGFASGSELIAWPRDVTPF